MMKMFDLLFDEVKDNTWTLIDGDIIAYQVGHKVEADAKEWGVPVESIGAGIVKNQIMFILHQIERFHPAAHTRIYLTSNDKSNFRFERATILEYKGNRKDTKKPYFLIDIRDYLIDFHEAEVIYGMEADDKLAIEATTPNRKAVICTNDKDLNMVDVPIYNIRTRKTSPTGQYLKLNGKRNKLSGRGWPWFFAQMMLGDSADNIPKVSIDRDYGAVGVFNLLGPCIGKDECFKEVWRVYKEKWGSTAKARFLEVAALLWMKTHQIPDIEKWLEENYELN